MPATVSATRYDWPATRVGLSADANVRIIVGPLNAVDENGLFNLDTLAAAQKLGKGGGHLVVLSDYTVTNVPDVGIIGEGDVSDELKAKALEGDLDYVVAKNSWGMNREDRPWLGNGYSRISDQPDQ